MSWITPAPSAIHSLRLSNQEATSPALDQNYLYWVPAPDSWQIQRYPLAGGTIETVVTSRFAPAKDAYVGSFGLRRRGDWLIFTDTRESNYVVWLVRALNIKTGQDQVVIEDEGQAVSPYGPEYEADGDWFVWTVIVRPKGASCDQSILKLKNLNSGEVRELDRVCVQDNYIWAMPQISGNTLVAEQDLFHDKGNSLVLFDLTTGKRTAFTDNTNSSMPSLSGKWLSWKDTPRYSWGHVDVIYDLGTARKWTIEPPVAEPADPTISGHWLYWRPLGIQPFFAYNLQTSQLYQIAKFGENESFDNVAVDGNNNLVAWSRNPQRTSGTAHDHILEWRTLP